MGGRASRNKGKRGEYMLRDALRTLGYEAIRVPLSGASEGYKGDVVAKRADGEEVTFEAKWRKDGFTSVYSFFEEYADNGLLRFTIGDGPETEYITVTTDPSHIMNRTVSKYYLRLERLIKPIQKRVISTLKRLKASSDVLVLKANQKPLLYLEFRS